jgi:hypothetical protein
MPHPLVLVPTLAEQRPTLWGMRALLQVEMGVKETRSHDEGDCE